MLQIIILIFYFFKFYYLLLGWKDFQTMIIWDHLCEIEEIDTGDRKIPYHLKEAAGEYKVYLLEIKPFL